MWKQEDLSRRQAEDRERQAREEAAWRQSQEARKREAATAELGSLTERQRREEENRRYAAEEAKREEERARRRVTEDKRVKEQDGIMRRQQEAEAAARAARRDIARLTPSPHPPPSAASSAPAPYRMPEPEHNSRSSGRSVYAPQPSRPQESYSGSGFSVMPLENPLKYDEDSATDVEGPKVPWSRQRATDPTPKAKHPGYVASRLVLEGVLRTLSVWCTRRQSRQRLPLRRTWGASSIRRSCRSTSSSRATCPLYSPCSQPLLSRRLLTHLCCSIPNRNAAAICTITPFLLNPLPSSPHQ